MFLTSFVLQDWALHELITSPRHRRVAILLVASSYVTWTYQTNTFSNSVETLVVAWSLVLIQRIVDIQVRPHDLYHQVPEVSPVLLVATNKQISNARLSFHPQFSVSLPFSAFSTVSHFLPSC